MRTRSARFPARLLSALPLVLLVLTLMTSSGCAYIAAGVVLASSGGGGGGGKKAKPAVPVVFLGTIPRQVGDVAIDYTLQDGDTDPADISVEYSTDSGSTFTPTTEAATGSDGTMALPTSVSGTAHTYAWDSAIDLGPGAFPGVLVRITPSDEDGTGAAATSDPFFVGNDAPSLQIADPTTDFGLVPITFTLFDSTNDLCSITAEFSPDNGVTPFAPATIEVGNTVNLDSAPSPTGVVHSVAWNSIADVGAANLTQVVVRLTPGDDFDTGTAVTSNPFAINNNDSPVAFIRPVPRQDGDVTIDFDLYDVNSDDVDVVIEYSDDGGSTWLALELVAPNDQTTGLGATPQGVQHVVVWNSDSPTQVGLDAATVELRITPSDPAGSGVAFVSDPFVVGNVPPAVAVTPITGSASGVIKVEYQLSDTTSDPANLAVEYTTDGGTSWQDCTISVGITEDAPTAPAPGLTQAVDWASSFDLANISIGVIVRITPSDAPTGLEEFGLPDDTGSFSVNNFDLPVAFIASPVPADVVTGDFSVRYLLFDSQSTPLDITMEYSTVGPTGPWTTATECGGCGSQGTTGLNSDPDGVEHFFGWASNVDFPGTDVPLAYLRIIPFRGATPGPEYVTSTAFSINNNVEPEVIVETPPSPQEAGDITLNYFLVDVESDPVDVVPDGAPATGGIEFSTDGGLTWALATEQAGPPSEGTTGLASGDPGVAHVFVWDSIADGVAIGAKENDAIVRIRPTDFLGEPALGQGRSSQTVQFAVDNTVAPVVNNLFNTILQDTIPISYDLFDTEPPAGATVDLEVSFSTNGGGSFAPATIDNPSEGTFLANIISGQTPSDTPPGAGKTFDWLSGTDVGKNDVSGVILRVIPRDTKVGAPTDRITDIFNNDPPSVTIQTPGGIPRDNIVLSYNLVDSGSHPASITPEYSTDSINYLPATESVGPPSQGTSGLDTNPGGGVEHIFVWDSVADLGTVFTANVRFRITPADTATGPFATSGPFDVNNQDLLPAVRIEPVSRNLPNDVNIDYLISDGDSDPASITVEYQVAGGGFLPATEQLGPPSDGTSGLATSPGGTPHTFVWDSATDLGPTGAVDLIEIRIVPTDADGLGFGDTSNPFIRGNDRPSVTMIPPAGSPPSGLIQLDYDLFDSTSDPSSLTRYEWTTDGGVIWNTATITFGATTDLPSSPGGTRHSIGWNSLADLGEADVFGVTFLIQPTDAWDLGIQDTVTFDVGNNDLPISFIRTPAQGDLRSGDVTVQHILIDSNSDDCTITVEFSTNNGISFAPATIKSPDVGAVSGNDITGVTSSQGGLAHDFVWESGTDLAAGFGTGDSAAVRLRLTPFDGKNTGVDSETGSFRINNNVEPQIFPLPSLPPGDQFGDVTFNYTMRDAEGDDVTVTVTYSTDGGSTFADATLKKCNAADPGTVSFNTIQDLPTTPAPGGFCIVWDSAADLSGARETSVVVRLAPGDNFFFPALGDGVPQQSSIFVIDNTSPPDVRLFSNGSSSGTIRIDYRLFDADPAPFCDITITYSTDGFATEFPATLMATDDGTISPPGNNVIENQVPSNAGLGAAHWVDWDSSADIGPTDVLGVELRFVAEDSKTGLLTNIHTLDVFNNDVPVVDVSGISGVQTRTVDVNYSILDTFSDLCSITVQYSVNSGGSWATATEGAGSDGTANLGSGPVGQEVGHLFVWDAYADLSTVVYTDSVQIRIQPSDPFGTGAFAYSNIFSMDTSLSADLVLGQPNMFQGGIDGRGVTSSAFSSYLANITTDGSRLYVSDSDNNRLLILNAFPASDFQTADLVLGQQSMTENTTDFYAGTTASTLDRPYGAYWSGSQLYVADTHNSRVLVWDSFPTDNGQAADKVIGQGSFTYGGNNRGSGPAANSMYQPRGVWGTANHLYVCDYANHRVLIWNLPLTYSGFEGPAADYVLGQSTFTTQDPDQGGIGADTLEWPNDVHTDGTTLFVSDGNNNRVLQWDIPGTWTNKRPADRVLGQPDFISQNPDNGGQSCRTFNRPTSVWVDANNTYVTDVFNNRTLIYNSTAPATNACADVVVGQPDMTSDGVNRGGPAGANTHWQPWGVTTDDTKMAIFDLRNHRVLIYNSIPAAVNATADVVYGQRNFTDNLNNHAQVDARSFRAPQGVHAAGDRLLVADRQNSRVLLWNQLPNVDYKNADVVFGQADFTSSGGARSSTEFNLTSDAVYDPVADRIFVADRNNDRIMIFDAPFTTGMAATAALGVTGFAAAGGGAFQDELSAPGGMSWDGTYLWVCDTFNDRVMAFSNFAMGANADIVLGQADFTTNGANHNGADPAPINGDQSLDNPMDLVTADNKLFVADDRNSRVVVWDPIPGMIDAEASFVIGRPDWSTGSGCSSTQSRLCGPTGVEADANGVYVVDRGNNRVMVWDTVPTASGAPADRVIGQTAFNLRLPNYEGVTARTLYFWGGWCDSPSLVPGSPRRLWLPDGQNNRVLRLDITP